MATLVGVMFPLLSSSPLHAQHASVGRTFQVDCGVGDGADSSGPAQPPLRSLEEVNRLQLGPGDTVLFRRGVTCHGSLHPQGSGAQGRSISFGAYGTGYLPRIAANHGDEAVLSFSNQEYLYVSSLDLSGSTTFGVSIDVDKSVMHDITLKNLNVHDVRGPLKKKQSGLVVIRPTTASATFAGLHLESVRAYNTTQWAGIFIAGGSPQNPALNATVTNSVVHDVQGDGIVLFSAAQSEVRHSVAWHTGMQHQQSIGTPNAIWTWQCNQCSLIENEAFLSDSPGVDGGAFDIDWGNTLNSVKGNFGHDTAGYCISVFGANGPTKQSRIEGNFCLHNGLSPRLAQRQGALLLMTWNGGSIDGLVIAHNHIDWDAGGNTPVLQTGAGLKSSGITIVENEFRTSGTQFIDPSLIYSGERNHYFLRDATDADVVFLQKETLTSKEKSSDLKRDPSLPRSTSERSRSSPWKLIAEVSSQFSATGPDLAHLFVDLKTAATEFSHAGLHVELYGDDNLLRSARDWSLPEDGVTLHPRTNKAKILPVLQLNAPGGNSIRVWQDAPTPIDLGLELRRALGEPVYGRLPLENVRATD